MPRSYEKVVKFIQNQQNRAKIVLGSFSICYLMLLYRARTSDNEILRIGAAGTLISLLGESVCYPIEAVNQKCKALTSNVSFTRMVREVLCNEGISGLYKGYICFYYSAITSGFLYFYVYKGLKTYMKEKIRPESRSSAALVYAFASSIAECLSLLIYYPYEVVKVRMLTKSHVYQYKSIPDAFY